VNRPTLLGGGASTWCDVVLHHFRPCASGSARYKGFTHFASSQTSVSDQIEELGDGGESLK